MQAFLYIDLSASSAYHNTLVNKVKAIFPNLTLLDIDGQSGELLQHYALRILKEAEQLVICIKAQEEESSITMIMPLLEELFQCTENRLVLLTGPHNRLQRIFAARPELAFQQVREEEVVAVVQEFLTIKQ